MNVSNYIVKQSNLGSVIKVSLHWSNQIQKVFKFRLAKMMSQKKWIVKFLE